jgi:O-antigen/teichoic acid export membrane protein
MTGAASALVARLLNVGVSIAVVPLTVRYLGTDRYGVWVTISTTIALLNFIDFGLEDSLTNALGRAYGRDDHVMARRYISSAFFTLCAITLLLVAVGWVFVPRLAAFVFAQEQTSELRTEIVPAIAIAYGFFALRFPFLISNRVLSAYGENAIANLWSIAGSVANFTAVLLVIFFHGGLPWLVLGSTGLGFVITVASAIWLFALRRPWLRPRLGEIDGTMLKELFSTGWKFFLISAVWWINTETDTIIISRYLGASWVTPFNITFQLFTVTMAIQTLVMPSLWPAYTEAYARHDFVWIRRAFRSNARLSLLSTSTVVIIFIACGQQIIRAWAGPAAVPPFSLLVWMGLWNVLLAQLYAFGCLLNALGRLGVRLVCSPITALLNIALSVLLVRHFGISGVTAATVVAFLVADYLPVRRQIHALFNEFRRGEKNARVSEASMA